MVAGGPAWRQIPRFMPPPRRHLACLLLLALAFPAGDALAQGDEESDAGGLIGLSLPVGTRIIGQGRVAVALMGELQASPYNPAVLAGIERGAVTFSQFESADLADVSASYVAGAWTAPWGTIAVQGVYDDFGEIVVTDASPDPIGRIDVNDWAIGVSYANAWRGLAYGATAKWYSSDFGVEDGSGPAFDAGVVYTPDLRSLPLHVGVAVRNVGPDIEFDRGGGVAAGVLEGEPGEEQLPSTIRFGVALQPRLGLSDDYDVTLAFDVENDLREFSSSSLHGGASVVVHEIVVVRGGVLRVDNPFARSGDDDANVGGTFGVGIRHEGFEADVSREVSVSELGDETHFSVGYRF